MSEIRENKMSLKCCELKPKEIKINKKGNMLWFDPTLCFECYKTKIPDNLKPK